MADRPPIHTLVIGDSGAGKSTFAATYPKPMLVKAFDPFGKDMPYLKVAGTAVQPLYDIAPNVIAQDVVGAKSGHLRIRIEHYNDADMTNPVAYAAFLKSMVEFNPAEWATIVLDSVTYAELAARKWHQYGLNKTAKDPRQWFGGSTDLLEEMLMGRLSALPINVVVIAHIDEEKDEVHGTFVRSPKAPGRLRKGLPSAFGEVYRAYIGKDDAGERAHLLQTASDNVWQAMSGIGAPNPALPHYKALWPSEAAV